MVLSIFFSALLPLPALCTAPFVPHGETLNYEVEKLAGEGEMSFLTNRALSRVG